MSTDRLDEPWLPEERSTTRLPTRPPGRQLHMGKHKETRGSLAPAGTISHLSAKSQVIPQEQKSSHPARGSRQGRRRLRRPLSLRSPSDGARPKESNRHAPTPPSHGAGRKASRESPTDKRKTGSPATAAPSLRLPLDMQGNKATWADALRRSDYMHGDDERHSEMAKQKLPSWRERCRYVHPTGANCETVTPRGWEFCVSHTGKLGEQLDESRVRSRSHSSFPRWASRSVISTPLTSKRFGYA